jgi:hypothetical protein
VGVDPIEAYPRLRQSLLAVFDRCGLSTKFEIEHLRGWSNHDQVRGTVFHRVAARCLEELAEQGEAKIPVDVALEVLEDEIRMATIDVACPSCHSEAIPAGGGQLSCGECGRRWTTEFAALPAEQVAQLRISVITFAARNEFDVSQLVGVEERLRCPVRYFRSDGASVERELSGQLDALFFDGERATVLDWKDTFGLPPETGLSFGGYFQQRFYAFLVMSHYRAIQSVTLREHYVRLTEFREATVGRDELADIEAELSAVAERFDRAVRDDLWAPSPGKHCGFCPRPTACPIFPDARGEGAITDAETAERYAAEALVAKAAYDKRQKQLKAWANVHGPVAVADAKGRRAWGYVPKSVTVKPDADAVRDEVERARREGRPPDIDALYRRRSQTRFEQFVPGLEEKPTEDDDRLAELMEESLRQIRERQANEG